MTSSQHSEQQADAADPLRDDDVVDVAADDVIDDAPIDADVIDAPKTVQLRIVRAEPLDDTDRPTDGDVEAHADADASAEVPDTLPGVIAHHLDALRDRDADTEVLELVTYELRKLTGRRSVRALLRRRSA